MENATNSETLERSNNIHSINRSTVLKICSGQVVISLAVAVKELVENSIDAGATNIEITLKEFGLVSVEVFDNGSGVQEKDLSGLAARYHTSKLKEFSDLRTISTLGFRGEALSSLCSLSDVEITTRHQSSPFGWCLIYDHDGNIVSKKPCAHPVGTSVVISNLFSTLPVRKKEFSRNIKKEYNKLIELLQAYCIICKNIRIKCNNITNKGSKTALHTKGNNSNINNISDVFGSKQVSNLVEITSTLSNGQSYSVDSFQEVEKNLNIALKSEDVEKMNERIKFEGWISSCAHGCGRNSIDRQFFYINSRPCEPKQIKKMVNTYYRQYNNSQYPFVFLNIEINTHDMDINLTPDKRLILIHNETLILCMLKLSMYNLFRRIASTHKLQNISLLSEINHSQKETVNDSEDNKNEGGMSTKLSQFLLQFEAGGNTVTSKPCNISKLSSHLNSLNTTNKRKSIQEIMAENFKNKKIRISASKVKAKETNDLTPSYLTDEENEQEKTHLEGKIECKNLPSYSNNPKIEYYQLPKEELLQESPILSYDLKTEEIHHEEKTECGNMPSSSNKPKIEYYQLPKPELLQEPSISPYFRKTEAKHTEMSIIPILNAESVTSKFDCNDNSTSSIPQYSASNTGSSSVGLDPIITITPIPNSEINNTTQKNMYFLSNTSLNSSSEPQVIISDAPNKNNINFMNASSSKTVLKDPILILDSDEETDVEKNPKDSNNGDINITIEQIRSMCIRQKNYNLKKKANTLLKRVKFVSQIQAKENKNAEEELQREISNDMFDKMKIIGQFNLGFIITQFEEDLFIVDQHASDEKYNFEKLQNSTILQSQKLAVPQNMNLSTINELVLMDHLNVFQANGFKFQIDNDASPTKRIKLISKPFSQNWEFGKDDILELIFMLQDSSGDFICRPSRIRSMFASRACRKSVMIGTALDKSVMKTLITNMGKIDEPWSCPHGRPTMRHLINIGMLEENGKKYKSRRFTSKKEKK